MMSSESSPLFAGSIPQFYAQYLVPMLFEPYAADLAARVADMRPNRVLELAAGTGVVTRHLARVLTHDVTIIATDLSQPMLDQAAQTASVRPVEWCQADAQRLPFPDQSFDVVVCQFGVMFFADKVQAFSEARRVLRPQGQFIFNVWDRVENNEFADTVLQAVRPLFRADRPPFLTRIPHGYFDPAVIQDDLVRAGFTRLPRISTMTAQSRADAPHLPAMALCQGTPMRNELEAQEPDVLQVATEQASAAMAARFGTGAVEGQMQALVVVAEAG
ncbi:class I SAM-dependent methyltransferase [Deinococcus sp. QL22]|uniref:class I SAM-dependent methyltransferase n=1 Tax=Deinococcus sp. QL22 TaxID=2939437 RepID=UPI0020174DCB|nr:class I SAM-dependent methyltransferase [Deinococcus sp. QL22]UQN10021.1 class I SAM-dependent methyltransferase [Deinococcus sp. QL22]